MKPRVRKPNPRQSGPAIAKKTDSSTRRGKPKTESALTATELLAADVQRIIERADDYQRQSLMEFVFALRNTPKVPEIPVIRVAGRVPLNKRAVMQAVTLVPTSVRIGHRQLSELRKGERVTYTDGTGKYYGSVTRSPYPNSDEYLLDCRVEFPPLEVI